MANSYFKYSEGVVGEGGVRGVRKCLCKKIILFLVNL
jgi:hypothetical protein